MCQDIGITKVSGLVMDAPKAAASDPMASRRPRYHRIVQLRVCQ